MTSRFDPRGDLPPPSIQFESVSYTRTRPLPLNSDTGHINKRLSSMSITSKPRIKPCYDWIFSSGTNTHIAIDRSAFKQFIKYKSYVVALCNGRHIQVEGIGIVELKVRRRPDSKEGHVIVLTDVLHIPTWPCNIFSDVYFQPGHDFEHLWTKSGVQFSRRTGAILCAWGYTESFRCLDRLVLVKRHKDSRSPMLEDKDREVFSINVTWPQSERDCWRAFLVEPSDPQLSRVASEPGFAAVRSPPKKVNNGEDDRDTSGAKISRRSTLSVANANIARGMYSKRRSSLNAILSHKNLSQGNQ